MLTHAHTPTYTVIPANGNDHGCAYGALSIWFLHELVNEANSADSSPKPLTDWLESANANEFWETLAEQYSLEIKTRSAKVLFNLLENLDFRQTEGYLAQVFRQLNIKILEQSFQEDEEFAKSYHKQVVVPTFHNATQLAIEDFVIASETHTKKTPFKTAPTLTHHIAERLKVLIPNASNELNPLRESLNKTGEEILKIQPKTGESSKATSEQYKTLVNHVNKQVRTQCAPLSKLSAHVKHAQSRFRSVGFDQLVHLETKMPIRIEQLKPATKLAATKKVLPHVNGEIAQPFLQMAKKVDTSASSASSGRLSVPMVFKDDHFDIAVKTPKATEKAAERFQNEFAKGHGTVANLLPKALEKPAPKKRAVETITKVRDTDLHETGSVAHAIAYDLKLLQQKTGLFENKANTAPLAPNKACFFVSTTTQIELDAALAKAWEQEYASTAAQIESDAALAKALQEEDDKASKLSRRM